MKLNSDLSTVIFSSYIGGAGNDGAYSVAVNPVNNNIYVAGSTQSTDLPGDKTSVISNTYSGGNTEGYISIISGSGTSIIKTTYLGTTGDDMLYFVRLDPSNYPYVTGTTTGTWNITNAAFSQAGGRQFISKLQPDLSGYVYSTVFGKGFPQPDICPTALGVDNCENVYVAGWGGSTNTMSGYSSAGTSGLVTTSGAIQTVTDGNDFYFFALDKNAAGQKFGTFFGKMHGQYGDHSDGGTSRFDANGTLYLAVCDCFGGPNPFPTTAGSWSQTSGNLNNCNLAGVKYEFGFCSSSMPVNYASFTAACINNKIRLNWSTAYEQNAGVFEIEKRFADNNWKRIGIVPASNNLNGSNYSFTDEEGANNLYRLKQVDQDGKFYFSPVIEANCNSRKNEVYVYPVPSKDLITISFKSERRCNVTLQLMDITGRIVLQEQQPAEQGTNSLSLNINKLARGYYTLKLMADGNNLYSGLILRE